MKALTPVLATVLLMTVSVAATASAFVFLTDLQQQAQESARQRLSEQEEEASSSINMRTVYNGTDGYTIFNLQNTGSTTLTIEEDDQELLNLYINGRPHNWKYVGSDPSNVRLNPTQSKRINSTQLFPRPNKAQNLRVTGPSSTEDAHRCYNDGTNLC
jgi:archaellum component FlaG (FlaF/FlaG flagellin family)